jgi:CRP-like cAMP-binding protein
MEDFNNKEAALFCQLQLEKILVNCQLNTVVKGTIVLRPGSPNKYFFYVQSGLLRQYTVDDKGKEHNIQFAPEFWFIGDRERIINHHSSDYFFQALEDTTFVLIDPSFINQLAMEDAQFASYNNQLLHKHIQQLQKRINMLLSASAEERYLDFIQTYPNLTLRISQVMIASYLGIAPESLSRVRKELAQRHHK